MKIENYFLMKRLVTIVIILVLISGCVDTPESVAEKESNIVKDPKTTITKSPVNTTKKNLAETVTPIQTTQSVNANFISIANKTMTLDDIWDVGNGWSLTVNVIDNQTKYVWLVLFKDGINVLEDTPKVGQIFTYNKSNRFFSLKVSSIFLGKNYYNTSTTVGYSYNYQNFVILEDIKYKVD